MRIAVIGTNYLQNFTREIIENNIFPNIEIVQILSGKDMELSKIASEINHRQVQVVILGPIDYKTLCPHINIPCYIIRPSMVDFLSIASQIEDYSKTCLLLPEGEEINLSTLEQYLSIKINKEYYKSKEDIENVIQNIKQQGYNMFIGSNVVIEKTDQLGFRSIYYCSRDGLETCIRNAVQLVNNLQKEEQHLKEIMRILSSTINGVVATTPEGIINYANDSALQILHTTTDELYGKEITQIVPKDIVEQVLVEGQEEYALTLWISNIQIIGNFIPISKDACISGSYLIFEDTSKILKYEKIIRKEIRRKNFMTYYTFDNIIGTSDVILNTIERAKRFALSDYTILITAETGTGKEVFAQSIHNYSQRKTYPFVAINCGAIPDSLIESELFGYETGAFTGASSKGKPGLIELANHGTVFLDDIDSISMGFQSKLLRVLQEQEIIHIGGNRTIPIDVRFIVATNRNLKTLVEEQKFRNDLFYRLNVLRLSIPPLRNRKKDIPDLCKYYLKQLDPNLLKKLGPVLKSIFIPIYEYSFFGNVRELISIIQRFIILVDRLRLSDTEYLSNLIVECVDAQPSKSDSISLQISGDYGRDIKFAEHQILLYYLDKHEGNMTYLAKKLGIGRTTLYSKIKNPES